MFRFVLFIYCCILAANSQVEDLQCTEKFCVDYLNNPDENKCMSVPQPCKIQNSTHNGVVLPSPVPCNCCEFCLANIHENDHCSPGSPGSAGSKSICGDGLMCDPETYVCVPMSSTCMDAKKDFEEREQNGLIGHLEVKPSCDRNGLYKPYVCIPGEICYCVDEDGNRIFGTIPFTSLVELLLKCQCSRKYTAAKKIIGDSLYPVNHLRCQSNGDYDPIQCLDEENCYCVDIDDGALTFPNIPSVPLANISDLILPCFDKNRTDPAYYKPCEKIFLQRLKEVQMFEEEEIEVLGFQLPFCQVDGYYEAVQMTKTNKFCVDIFGKQLGDYVVPLEDPLADTMNCNCARSMTLINVIEPPDCLQNGNYNPIQCRRGLCRCVDINGNQIDMEVAIEDVETLTC